MRRPDLLVRARRLTAAAIAGALLVPLAPSAMGSAAVPPMRFDVAIWGCRVGVSSIARPDGTPVTVTVRRADGTLLGVRHPVVESTSVLAWYLRPHGARCAFTIRAGDRISLKVGDTKQTFRVPSIVPFTDPVGAVTRGWLPDDGGSFALLTLDLATGDDGFVGHSLVPFLHTTGAGSWYADVHAVAERSVGVGDALEVVWSAWNGSTSVIQPVAGMTARPGTSSVSGIGRRGRTVRVTLLSPSGTVRASGSTRVTRDRGAWTVVLRHDGARVRIRAGDRLISNVVPDASLRVIDPGLTLDAATGLLSGRCHAGGWAWATYASEGASGSVGLMLGPDGRFSTLDLAGLRPFPPEMRVALSCHTSTGMEVRDRATPS